jgi:hypothetical protein
MCKFRFTRMYYYDSNHAVVISFIADKTFMGLDNKINTLGGVFKKQELCIYFSQATWCIPFLFLFFILLLLFTLREHLCQTLICIWGPCGSSILVFCVVFCSVSSSPNVVSVPGLSFLDCP